MPSGEGGNYPILSHGFRDGDAERGEAVEYGNQDLELGDLTVEFARGQALAQQLDAVHFGFCTASAVIPAPSSPYGPADLLVGRNLIEQFGQHRRITDVAGGELGGPNFQRFLVDPDVDLAPDAPLRAPVFTVVPLAFTLDLDPGAVHQQVQGTCPSRDRGCRPPRTSDDG